MRRVYSMLFSLLFNTYLCNVKQFCYTFIAEKPWERGGIGRRTALKIRVR